jgi:hypothetical protein
MVVCNQTTKAELCLLSYLDRRLSTGKKESDIDSGFGSRYPVYPVHKENPGTSNVSDSGVDIHGL